jgi:hypothetical protein
MKKILLLCITILLLCVNLISVAGLIGLSDAQGEVFINEFQARPDPFTQEYKWIELYYNGTGTINLTDWKINDSDSNGNNLTGILDSSNRYIVFNGTELGFSIEVASATSEHLLLYNSTGHLIDNLTYSDVSADEENMSRGRQRDGSSTFVTFATPTKGTLNDQIPNGTIPLQQLDEDTNKTISLTSFIKDLDNDNLTFKVTGENIFKTDCAITNETNLTIIAYPDWNGTTNCTVQVNDSYYLIDFIVQIEVAGLNDAPVITSSFPSATATEDIEYTYDVIATDVDSNVSLLTYNVITPVNANFVNNTFKLTPTNAQANTIVPVEIEVSDGINTTTQEFNLTTHPSLDITEITINGISVEDNGTVSNVRPGETLTINFNIRDRLTKNLYNTKVDADIQNLESKSTQLYDLIPSQAQAASIQFNIPNILPQETFILTLDANGVDILLNQYTSQKTITLIANRSTHQIELLNKTLTPQNISCDKQTTLDIEIANQGNYTNAVDITTRVYTSDLSINTNLTKSITKNNKETFSFNINTENLTSDTVLYIESKGEYTFINTITDQITLEVLTCFDPSLVTLNAITQEDTLPTWEIDLTNFTTNYNSAWTYNLESESNASLIDCDIQTTLLTCAQPAQNQVGTSTLNISITAGSTISYYQATVEVQALNDAPTWTALIPSITVKEDSGVNDSINLSAYAADTETNPNDLTFTTTSLNVSEIICFTNGNILEFLPVTNWFGTGACNVTISDGTNSSAPITVQMIVEPVNDAPTINVDNQLFQENITKIFYVLGNDVDSTTLDYYLNQTPTGAIFTPINNTHALFNWTPTNNDVGTYNLLFTVTDDQNEAINKTITLTVGNENNAPTLDAINNQIVNESKLLQFYLEGSDIDQGEALTYTCNLTDLTVTKINNSLANVTWTPTANEIGTYNVECSVTDSLGASDSKTVTIEVLSHHIIYSPEQYPVIHGEHDAVFAFVMPAGLDWSSIIWKENEEVKATNTQTYTFGAKHESAGYHVRVEIEDDQGTNHSYDWYPTTTTYPQTTGSYTTEQDLSALNSTQLQNTNLTIKSGNSQIEFQNSIDLSAIATINNILIENGVAAVNVSGTANSVFSGVPAQITLTGLTYNDVPVIYYDGAYKTDANDIDLICPTSRCKLHSYTSYPTTSGTVIFNVSHFSSYRVGDATQPTNPGTTPDPTVPGTGVLEIDDVDVNPDEAKPDETVEIKVDIENNGDLDIEDIELEIKILDENGEIVEDEDDDELEDDEEFDLDEGDDEQYSFTFKMPADAEDGDEYTVYVKACGQDDNNQEQCALDTSQTIDIEREKHDVEIYSASVSPLTLTCSNIFDINVGVKNIGKKDEDVTLKIMSSELEMSKSQTFELEESDEDDYKKTISYAFMAPSNLAKGNYPITIRADYGDESETETIFITKGDCRVDSKPQEKEEDVIVTPKQGIEQVTGASTTKFQDTFEYTILLSILIVLVLGIIIFFIGAIIIKK